MKKYLISQFGTKNISSRGTCISHHRQRGAEIVEFALTLLPFLVVFFSFLIAGFIMYTQVSVAYLAREGVQWAIKRGNDAAEDPLRTAPEDIAPDNVPATANDIRDFVRGISLLRPIDSVNVSACWRTTCYPASACGALEEGVNNLPGSCVKVTVSYTFNPPLADYIWREEITASSSAEGVVLY